MKKPYQIETQRAVKQFEAMAADGDATVHMILPMAEMVGWLRKGVGELVRQAGRPGGELPLRHGARRPSLRNRLPAAEPVPQFGPLPLTAYKGRPRAIDTDLRLLFQSEHDCRKRSRRATRGTRAVLDCARRVTGAGGKVR